MDPAMFRWYAADMMQYEYFRYTPRSVFLYAGSFLFLFYLAARLMFQYEVCSLLSDVCCQMAAAVEFSFLALKNNTFEEYLLQTTSSK